MPRSQFPQGPRAKPKVPDHRSGVVTTVAGTDKRGYHNRIRKIDKTGAITTIAGTGKPGFSGDGGLAANAELEAHMRQPWIAYLTALTRRRKLLPDRVGGIMSLRTKLTVGIGFLFVLIFALSLYSSYDIHRLSRDADGILRDNYDSLVYCKNMLVALDDMRTVATSSIFGANPASFSGYRAQLFESSKSSFETNLRAEENNITELHEKEYVAELAHDYGLFLSLCQQIDRAGKIAALYFNEIMPAYSNTRQTIISVNDLNMQAIERKNLMTKHNATTMITSLAVVGAILVILAFFYFWYFPFYISNTMSYLSNKMKELLNDAGIRIDTRTNDEAFILLQSIDLLHEKFADSKAKGAVKRTVRKRS
jgi:hypothetical protein